MNWERFEDDPLYSEIFTYWYDEWNSISEEVKNGMIGINIVNIRVVLLDIINEYELNQFESENNRKVYIKLIETLISKKYINIFQDENIEWIGNEVSCGVGMQRIDIMLSVVRNDNKVCMPIELKSTEAYLEITKQVQRYIDWLKQYYLPNRPSDLEPMIISRQIQNKSQQNYLDLVQEFNTFNTQNNLRLRYVEFNVVNQDINFQEVIY